MTSLVSESRCQALERRVFKVLGEEYEIHSTNGIYVPPRCVVDVEHVGLRADYPQSPYHYRGAFELSENSSTFNIPYRDDSHWEAFISRLKVPGCRIAPHLPALETGVVDEEGVAEIETPTMFLWADCEGDKTEAILGALRRWRSG